jgi:hypothetical protein
MTMTEPITTSLTSGKSRDYIAVLMTVCAITVILVTLIDFRIKSDILKAANQAHNDLARLKALAGIPPDLPAQGVSDDSQDNGRVQERVDISTSSDGDKPRLVSRAHVDTDDAGLEKESDSPAGRAAFVAPGSSATNGATGNGRKAVRPRSKPVGS